MKLFSDCSGECCLCASAGGCLAGHGDDDFCPANKEQIIERLNKGKYKNHTEKMKAYLKYQFGYDYDKTERDTIQIPEREENNTKITSFDRLKALMEELNKMLEERVDYVKQITGKELTPHQKQLFMLYSALPHNSKLVMGRGGRTSIIWPEEVQFDEFEAAGFTEAECIELRRIRDEYGIDPNILLAIFKKKQCRFRKRDY